MIQFHLHTQHSLRDSLIKIPELIDKATSLGMKALAVTEHGHLASAFEFYNACKEAGIQPLIGCEAYFVWDIGQKVKGERKQHFTLIAKNKAGYENLLALMSIAATEGFYYTPRIDFDLLEKYRGGLIAMSACSFKSVLYLYDESDEWSLRIARKLKLIFGRDFYLEIMPHAIDFQKEHNQRVARISEALDVPLIATQDSHYIDPGDREIHDILMQIQGRTGYGVDTLYFPSEVEVRRLFDEHVYLDKGMVWKAIEMTDKVAEGIGDYAIPTGVFEYPKFELTDEMRELIN